MSQSILQMEQEFVDYTKKITAYNEALALIYWDLRPEHLEETDGVRK